MKKLCMEKLIVVSTILILSGLPCLAQTADEMEEQQRQQRDQEEQAAAEEQQQQQQEQEQARQKEEEDEDMQQRLEDGMHPRGQLDGMGGYSTGCRSGGGC
jgi:hemolysin activation/secretion protein